MPCQRCGGLLVRDERVRPLRMAHRCLNCGDVVDNQIAAQRRLQQRPGIGAQVRSVALTPRDQNRLWALIMDRE